MVNPVDGILTVCYGNGIKEDAILSLDIATLLASMNQVSEAGDRTGALMTLALPTGSGKTFAVRQHISRRIVYTDERFCFVANQNKSLHADRFYESIKREWITRELKVSQSDFMMFYTRKVAVLRSLPTMVNIITTQKLPKTLEHYRDIQEALETLAQRYDEFKHMGEDVKSQYLPNNHGLKQAYINYQRTIRQQLIKEVGIAEPISESDKETIKRHVRDKETPLTAYINRYLPTIDLANRQLIIVVADKFIRSYISFWGGYSITVSSPTVLNQATVIFDEIDGLKPILLNKIIDDALKIPIDFQPFFCQVYAGVNDQQKRRPADIMTVLRKDHRLRNLKSRTNELATAYKLLKDYKTKGSPAATNFIFNLSHLQITSSSAWWSRDDPDGKYVALQSTEPAKGNLNFYGMVRDVNKFIKYFVIQIAQWATSYQARINERRSEVEDYYQFADSVRTICDTLRLSNETQKIVLLEIEALKNIRGNVGDNLQNGHYGRLLQDHGMQLFSLTDSDVHLNRTEIGAAFIYTTPEQFLLKLARSNRVLGLSATADLETVISNFDFKYIQQQLGAAFIKGTELVPAATKEDMDVSSRCREQGVQVNVINVIPDPDQLDDIRVMQKLILKYHPNFEINDDNHAQLALLEQLVQQLMQQLKQKVSDNALYCQKRYLSLFGSFICFLSHRNRRVVLGLQSVLPKLDTEVDTIKMSVQVIEQVFELLAGLLCPDEKHLPQLHMIAKKLQSEPIEQQVAAALKVRSEEQTRVYLLSAYKTLGVGVNLVRANTEPDQAQIINIAPEDADIQDPRYKQIDIDGIYLGAITHLLTLIPECATKANTKQWIRGYYEYMELADADEISLNDIKTYARERSRGRPIKQFRNTVSYVGAQTQCILQAIGRLDRTFNKVAEVTVIIGDGVLDYYNVTSMAPYQLGPIAQALQDYQRQSHWRVVTSEVVKKERWRNHTNQSQEFFNQVKHDLQVKAVVARRYQKAREFYLQHPTLMNNQRTDQPEFAYLDMQANAYHVQRNGEMFDFPENNNGRESISAAAAGLPILLAYPGMLAHFKQNQWAIEWESKNYILNPVQFDNYCGILGEVSAQFVIKDQWQYRTSLLGNQLNELFDFQLDKRVLVDVKNWRYPHNSENDDEQDWVLKKLARVCKMTGRDDWKVLIVNLIEPDSDLTFTSHLLKGQRVMELPALLNRQGQFVLTETEKQKVATFIHEY